MSRYHCETDHLHKYLRGGNHSRYIYTKLNKHGRSNFGSAVNHNHGNIGIKDGFLYLHMINKTGVVVFGGLTTMVSFPTIFSVLGFNLALKNLHEMIVSPR